MEASETKLLVLIDAAIAGAKAKSNGNKFHQGVHHGYVKGLEQVRFAMTVRADEGGTAHLEKGVDA